MRRIRIRTRTLVLAAAIAAVAVSPHVLRAGDAACSVLSSSLTDALLNPPEGEDTDFFVTSGGIPNVSLFLDTSESMLRVAPDGAAKSWGSFQDPATKYGCGNAYAATLKFQSSCGDTTYDGAAYDPLKDFYGAKRTDGNYCGYMDQAGKPMKSDKPGFDPDFPAFFSRYKIYRDAVVRLPPVGSTGEFTPPATAPDGWSSSTVTSAGDDSGSFCDAQFPAATDLTKNTTCKSCLNTKGYFFDGLYAGDSTGAPWLGPSCANTSECQARGLGTCVKDNANGWEWNGNNDNTAHCRVPRVWFVGNFLNFHPPKFLIARKVLKDVLAGVKLFRLGFFTVDGAGGGAVDQSGGFNPSCSSVGGESSFFNNRNSVRNTINNTVSFTGREAPLAEALMDLGHFYASASTNPWFGTYDDSTFRDKGGNQSTICYQCQKSSIIFITDGSPTHDDSIPGADYAAGAMTSTAAALATTYSGMPGYNIAGISTTDCPTCNLPAESRDDTLAGGKCYGQQASGACSAAHEPVQSYLPNVAWYLHNVDARRNSESAYDGYKMDDKQTIDVFTIGLGVRGPQADVLSHTATAGGGKSWATDAANDLRQALDKALDEVSTRSIAFGSSSLSTLQASASQGVLVPRFVPSKAATWNGHLYEFDLWSEFTGGCTIPTSGTSGPANGDYDCDGRCTSVFLREKGTSSSSGYTPGKFIHEDASGAFVQNSSPDLASCGSGNKCTAANCSSNVYASGTTPTPATAWWDAGDKLSPLKADGTTKSASEKNYRDWTERRIYTVVDKVAPFNRFTSDDPVMRFTDSTTALADLLPYLNVVGNKSFCLKLADKLSAAGNTTLASTIKDDASSVAPTWTACGKVVVEYAMGADVLNERRCSTYPTSYCTRPYQLGDVFHSSPVEVWPPLPSDGLLCVRGLHPQCLPSLFSQSIQQPSTTGKANAYDDYAKNADFKHRGKFALVGANDGMLHAILTGHWQPNADDPRTAQKEDRAPYEGYHDAGTGEEIWAFIPPDLLPKLHLMLLDDHHYFVDGTPMVRDVWIDGGTSNGGAGLSGAGAPSLDGIRQGSEFHTVAIVGERRGGTHYFALDVTRASDDLFDASKGPGFLWLYPQPDDKEQLAFGETYAEFVPTPPPIGPVRIDAGAPSSSGACPTAANRVYGSRCFEERWIVFLSGGYDPQLTKGRGVHMLDVGTGAELFDFSQPKGIATNCTDSSDPQCHLNYPVAAAVGMTMWGTQANHLSTASSDGYFDTATFGDTGGQLWVLRFNKPGLVDPDTHKVTNWYGARVFQLGKGTGTPTCGVNDCATQPFFHITANVSLQANGLYRVLAGTGDRFNLLDPTGGVCGPNNIRACLLKGCTVKVDDGTGGAGASYGVDQLGTDAYHLQQNAYCGSFDASAWSSTFTGPATGTAACSTAASRVRVEISCPSTTVCTGSVDGETLTKDVSVTCTGGSCSLMKRYPGTNVDLKNDTLLKNWFFSIQVFETSGARQIFDTADGAKAYDAARLNEAQLVSLNAHDASPTTSPLATPDSRGWAYYFDHGDPNTDATVSIGGADHHIYRSDERVASTTAVEASCAFFNTLQVALPVGALALSTDCPANSPCKAGKKQLSYLYGASPSTGDACLYVDGAVTRSQRTETLVPPHIGKLVAYVASGQVSFGLTSVRIPQGGTNISLGAAQDVTSIIDVLPVDRDLHDCRHASRTGAAPANCK